MFSLWLIELFQAGGSTCILSSIFARKIIPRKSVINDFASKEFRCSGT